MMERLVLAFVLGVGTASYAADTAAPANRFAATLAPAERFEVGATLVERHGQVGTPLILIPGLASGAWAWQETVRQMMGEHVVYVLTLPGFDGRAPVAGKGIAAAQDSVRELIVSHKLHKPVLVGHSLGGMIALALAEQHPDLVGGVVSIDGLPLFPGTEDWPLAQRVRMAGSVAARDAGNPVRFAAQQRQYMRGMGVMDMARADELAGLTSRSDPAAVAAYMADALALDLRPQLAAIQAPVLLIAPYFDADAEQQQMTQDGKTEYYQSLMKGTPHLKVMPVAPARHFVMFDQPQMVNDAIREFLKGVPQ
jgi:pimeloyl-ACP methyl ester carboxylesterase